MAELDDIPSNFNINDYIDVVAGNDASCLTNTGEGKIRFLCDPSHLAWDDPIVFPNQTGAAHLHHFFGNTLTNAGSTYASLRTTGGGTCAGGPINRTAYWHPAMIRPGSPDKVVKPAHIEMYYVAGSVHTLTDFDSPNVSSAFAHPTFALQGFPRGFSMVWGWKHADEGTPFGVWSREDTAGATGASNGGLVGPYYGTLADLAVNMPGDTVSGAGYRDNIFARITSPACWDGVNLTSATGRSHVAYAVQDGFSNSVCPSTHPYRIPELVLIASFSHNGPGDFSTWFLSSDRAAYGGDDDQAGGTSFHTDWFGGWDTTISDIWETVNLQVGGTATSQKTSNSGILCTGNKQLRESMLDFSGYPANGFGSFQLIEANRYLDIPTRYRLARVGGIAGLRLHR